MVPAFSVDWAGILCNPNWRGITSQSIWLLWAFQVLHLYLWLKAIELNRRSIYDCPSLFYVTDPVNSSVTWSRPVSYVCARSRPCFCLLFTPLISTVICAHYQYNRGMCWHSRLRHALQAGSNRIVCKLKHLVLSSVVYRRIPDMLLALRYRWCQLCETRNSNKLVCCCRSVLPMSQCGLGNILYLWHGGLTRRHLMSCIPVMLKMSSVRIRWPRLTAFLIDLWSSVALTGYLIQAPKGSYFLALCLKCNWICYYTH